jgi:IS30 family transposase
MLGRGKTTISNELKRNQINDEYVAAKAHPKAYARRRAAKFQGKKIVVNQDLQTFIDRALMAGQSPQAAECPA